MLYVKYGKNRLRGFRGEVVWKCWLTDDGCLPILKAHLWAFGSGELKKKTNIRALDGCSLAKSNKRFKFVPVNWSEVKCPTVALHMGFVLYYMFIYRVKKLTFSCRTDLRRTMRLLLAETGSHIVSSVRTSPTVVSKERCRTFSEHRKCRNVGRFFNLFRASKSMFSCPIDHCRMVRRSSAVSGLHTVYFVSGLVTAEWQGPSHDNSGRCKQSHVMRKPVLCAVWSAPLLFAV